MTIAELHGKLAADRAGGGLNTKKYQNHQNDQNQASQGDTERVLCLCTKAGVANVKVANLRASLLHTECDRPRPAPAPGVV